MLTQHENQTQTINIELALDPEYDSWLDSEDYYYGHLYNEWLAGQRLNRYRDLYEAHVKQIRAGEAL